MPWGRAASRTPSNPIDARVRLCVRGAGGLFSVPLGCPPSLHDPPRAPAWRRRRCSDRSSVLCGHPTSRQRRCRAYGLWPSPTRPPPTAQRALTRSPSSCAKSFSACSGSLTAWGPHGDSRIAPPAVLPSASAQQRRRSRWLISRLNGWPAGLPCQRFGGALTSASA